MGIVNVTPDSFSDGGLYLDSEKATDHALQLLDEGADIIDIGGESTRPGAKIAVSAEEELGRVLPVITALKKQRPDAVISIDTYKASVARAAVAAGAEIVNDVSGLRWDPLMRRTIAEIKCGAVLMHMRGRPEEWRTLPPPGDIVLLVKRELREWVEAAVLAGVRRERIALDPGFGFGKNFEQNYPLLARFQDLQSLGFPLVGRHVEEIVPWPHLGERWKRRCRCGPALRKSRRSHRLDSQGRAHPANARREGGRGSGPRG